MIDAHQHFWELARDDYGWLTPELPALYRDFQPEHLQPELVEAGISGTLLVQAAPTVAETEYLLKMAEQTSWVKGVVGWVAMDTPYFREQLDQINNIWLKGLRPMLQDMDDSEWILSSALDQSFDDLIESGLVFDALVKPPQWQPLLRRLQKHPKLNVVIDHGGKPAISLNRIEPWRGYIKQLATETSSYCKLSGLWSEAGTSLSLEAIRRWLDVLFEHFGPERIIWGSDWPVLTTVGQYQNWLELCSDYCQQLSAAQKQAVFGGNAIKVYQL